MSIFEGMFTGLVIGLVWSAPAFVSQSLRHGRGELPIITDVRTVWGRRVRSEDVLLWSVGLHLLVATLFGGLYPFLVELGVFPSFAARFIALYAASYWLFTGLAVFPALGLGLFGRREGASVWLELLLSHALYAASYWYAATRLLVP